MLLALIFVFGFALWLGAYLINRNPADLRLDLAGTGLLAYSIALALSILAEYTTNHESASVLLLWQKPFLYFARHLLALAAATLDAWR